jgi:hypothetical protein
MAGKPKQGLARVHIPAERKLAEKGSRVILTPSVADALRQVAKYDRLGPSELIERALVLYIDKYHPTWRRPEKKSRNEKADQTTDTQHGIG